VSGDALSVFAAPPSRQPSFLRRFCTDDWWLIFIIHSDYERNNYFTVLLQLITRIRTFLGGCQVSTKKKKQARTSFSIAHDIGERIGMSFNQYSNQSKNQKIMIADCLQDDDWLWERNAATTTTATTTASSTKLQQLDYDQHKIIVKT
jgi:hypothetical protein